MIQIRGLSIGAIARLAGLSSRATPVGPVHVFFCIADHFEPMWNKAPRALQLERVGRWVRQYPRCMKQFEDSRGQRPQHTFFYPAEDEDNEYKDDILGELAKLCHAGWADVEVHLHHSDDTSSHLRETLVDFKSKLYEHGLQEKNARGEITYGFIHGNWALDNSLPDRSWCGVNDELTVLRQTGCYADFTMPAAPDRAQTRTVNSIYYAFDDPLKPKSHDRGVAARVGVVPPRDGLLMIQGPTAFDWSRRRFGFLPRLENADLHKNFPPTQARLRRWLQAGISVNGRPNWIFVKLHTHGAPEANASMLLGEPIRQFHEMLMHIRHENSDFHYYYVTARQMADLVHQAERGAAIPTFDPNAADQGLMSSNRPVRCS